MNYVIVINFLNACKKILNGIYDLTDLEYYSLMLIIKMFENNPYDF